MVLVQLLKLIQGWTPTSVTQQMKMSTVGAGDIQKAKTDAAAALAKADKADADVTLPAGSIMYATLTTAITTDAKTPVLATIATGPLKGAKLMGTYALTNEELVVSFNKINFGGASQGISATALDGETLQTVVKGDKNRHILARYGLTFVTSFLEGVGDAALTSLDSSTSSTTTTTTDDSGNQQTTVTPSSNNDIDWQEIFVAAFSEVGDALSEELEQDQANIPTLTVSVPAGKMIGVLLTSDFIDQK